MTDKTIPASAAQEISAFNQALTFNAVIKAGAAAALTLVLANCASQPQQRGYSSQQAREFGAFSSPKYGSASPRVYADTGAALPKGGGRDHTGKAYSIAGRRYVPHDRTIGSSQIGMASWYGAAFHGRKTANGEIYDRRSFTAAHPTMPLPSYARVTNMRNGSSVIVRVNDRGPYHGGRIMDVSERVADSLQFKAMGTGRIRVDYLGRAGLGGSDDVRLAQSLTTDGRPATASYIPASFGENRTVQVASASQPVVRAQAVASAIPVQNTGFVATNTRNIASSAPAVIAAPVAAPLAAPVVTASRTVPVVANQPAARPVATAAPVPPSRPTSTSAKPVPLGNDDETGSIKQSGRSVGMAAAIAAAKASAAKATPGNKNDVGKTSAAGKTSPQAKAGPAQKAAKIALAD